MKTQSWLKWTKYKFEMTSVYRSCSAKRIMPRARSKIVENIKNYADDYGKDPYVSEGQEIMHRIGRYLK